MTMLESALGLASQGFRVFPLQEWSKVPATGNGFKSATKNPDQVGTWFSQLKRNIGIATGKGLLVFDCDVKEGKNGIDVLKQLEKELGTLPATLTAQTQSGGTHYYFSIPNTLDIRNATNWNGEGLDIRCNGGYVVAPPSSTRQGSYEWIHQSDIASLPQAWLDKLTPQKSKPSTPTFNSNLSSDTHLLDDVREALGFIDAHDYDTWVKVGMACYSMSNFDLWDEWSKSATNYNPSIMVKKWKSFTKGTKVNIESIFYMAQVNGWKNAATTRKDEFLNHGAHIAQQLIKSDQDKVTPNKYCFDGGEDLFTPTPIHWLIDGVIERNTLAAMFGASGIGKTFLSLDLSLCIASGLAWHGHEVDKGSVIYVAGEGKAGIKRRVSAWVQHNGHHEAIAENFKLSNRAVPFPEDTELFITALQQVDNLKLLVLDTLQRNSIGEENSSRDMGEFIRAMDEVREAIPNLVILIIHHSGHSSPDRARGSSVIRASLDTEIKVSKEPVGFINVSCTKAKDSEPFPTMSFSFVTKALEGWLNEKTGELHTSAVLKHINHAPISSKPIMKPLKGNQRAAMQVLNKLLDEKEARLNELQQDHTEATILITEWIEACRCNAILDKRLLAPSGFRGRILTPIERAGHITVSDSKVRKAY